MANELWDILSTARLDDKPYRVVDFFMKRKLFVIYVASVLKRTTIIEN